MRIVALKPFARRPRGEGFSGLDPVQRARAERHLARFIARRRAQGKPVPGWLKGIYVGQAVRLAHNPPTSDWGRRMRSRRGGLARQAQRRARGEPLFGGLAAARARARARVRAEDQGPQPPVAADRYGSGRPSRPAAWRTPH